MDSLKITFTGLALTYCLLKPLVSQAQYWQEKSTENERLAPYFCLPASNRRIDDLPLKDASANIRIAGSIACVELEQVFVNTGRKVLEAIYVFPGCTNAAVHGMEMRVGQRTIVAHIEERRQAREMYEQAKDQGRVTSLLEQQRPNVFEMHVANIAPGDEISVRLMYTEMIEQTDGIYEFVLPTTVGPRYSERNGLVASTRHQWVANPYLEENTPNTYGYHINLVLNAGMPIKDIKSPTHEGNFRFLHSGVCQLDLRDRFHQQGDRDFIIRYRLQGDEILPGLLLHEGPDENFFSLTIQPPADPSRKKIPGREFIFVVDVSGSMQGFPLKTARKLMSKLLSELGGSDKFNILLFAGGSQAFSPKSLPASFSNIERAERFISRTGAGGGTSLYNALRDAIEMEEDRELSRSIIVITDGFIDSETDCFSLIRNNLNHANVFAFGVGTSVNRYLIEGVSFTGHGKSYVVINDIEADEKVDQFVKDMKYPVLTNVSVDFGKNEVYDLEPASLSDVFATRPVVIFGKYRGTFSDPVYVHGRTDQPVRYLVSASVADESTEGLRFLWARTRVKYLSDYHSQSNHLKEDEIIDLGLKYSLLTPYTSFVAIDENGEKVHQKSHLVRQSIPLPAGVTNSAIGGGYSSPANIQSRMNATGAVSRAVTSAAISILAPSQVDVIGPRIAVRWRGHASTSYIITIKNIFDEVIFESEQAQEGILLDLRQIPAQGGLMILEVRDKYDENIASNQIGIKLLNNRDIQLKIPEVTETVPTTKADCMALINLLENKGFLLDALTQFELAIGQWPDDEELKESYQAFLIRHDWSY